MCNKILLIIVYITIMLRFWIFLIQNYKWLTLNQWLKTKYHVSYSWYMARFFNSEHNCWRILPAQIKILPSEQSCQVLLNNLTIDCWTFVPLTVEEICQWLLKNRASNCWTIVLVTVEELYRQLLKNCDSGCWRVVPVTVDESCQWLLNSRVPAVFLPLFLSCFGKIFTDFLCKSPNYY